MTLTDTDARHKYDLIFQGLLGGSAKVEARYVPSGKKMKTLHFSQGDKINIRILGPDADAASMASVQVDFTVVSAPTASPLGDGSKACFVWHAGERYTETVHANGIWSFGAVLTAKDKQTYTLPDPEFQVGDGG